MQIVLDSIINTLFYVISCFNHEMHQFPTLQISINRSLSHILNIILWFRTKKLHHSLLDIISYLWLLMQWTYTRTKWSTLYTIPTLTSSLFISLSLLIYLRYRTFITLLSKWMSHSWSILIPSQWFLLLLVLLVKWKLLG